MVIDQQEDDLVERLDEKCKWLKKDREVVQVDHVEQIHVDKALYLNAWEGEERECDQDVGRPPDQKDHVVVERACVLGVHIGVHVANLIFDLLIVKFLTEPFVLKGLYEDERHDVEEGDDADAWEDLCED